MSIEELKTYLSKDDIVCAVAKDDVLLTSNLKGIRPWLKWLRECPELLEDAIVVDKVIGKAAAMLMIVAKIKRVYTPTISSQALAYLKTQSLEYDYDRIVDFISNNERNGLCPMEATVIDTEDAYQGYQQLLDKVKELMAAKQT